LQLPANHSRSGTERQRAHPHNSSKDQDIRESHEKLSQAEPVIVEMMEQQLELNVQREREISELTIAIKGLEQEIAKQKADIAVLESQLQRPFTAPDHRLLKEL
jgi:predicted RNase H-like nuclease (RuvC/YqgF family)